MPVYRNKAAVVHCGKIIFLVKRVTVKTTEEIEIQEQLYQDRKEQAKLNKAGNTRGLSEGSRAGDGNKASGTFSKAARRSMQHDVDIFFMRQPMARGINPATGKKETLKAAMHTLTIPGGARRLDAKEFKKLLFYPYIQSLERIHGVEAYVAGLEFQTEEGNKDQLHCHLFVDKYIPKAKCKKRWISLLRKNGLMEVYDANHKEEPHAACDLRGIKTSHGLQFYLQKYLTKQKQKEGILDGHWHMASAWIKKADLPTFEPSAETERKVYSYRGSADFYFTDVYIDKETKAMLFNEAGSGAAGAKKMMTIVRGNYNKSTKQRADVRDLLAANDQQMYQAFVKAYRRCDWEWTNMAAMDLDQIARQDKENQTSDPYYQYIATQALKDRDNREDAWNRYIRTVQEKPKIKKKPPSPGSELPF